MVRLGPLGLLEPPVGASGALVPLDILKRMGPLAHLGPMVRLGLLALLVRLGPLGL